MGYRNRVHPVDRIPQLYDIIGRFSIDPTRLDNVLAPLIAKLDLRICALIEIYKPTEHEAACITPFCR
ncbi:hypothetical protein RSAG8_13676, partial [Rhizoctonia solani AG-8 WAC10335]